MTISGIQLIIIQNLILFILLVVNIAILFYFHNQEIHVIIENQEIIIQLLNSTRTP